MLLTPYIHTQSISMNILLTGSTSGIGAATAEILTAQGHSLWLLNRNASKTAQQIAQLKQQHPNADLHFVPCDLNELSSVAQAAAGLKTVPQIDVLINNAGGLTSSRETTTDGFEMQFQMNHLGHFLLTKMLLPQLIASKAKVINVSSEAHRAGKIDLQNLQLSNGWSAFGAYANAKLCNVLFTKALHEQYQSQGLTAYALHPGVVNTGFGDGLGKMKWMWKLMTPFLITPAKGAATTIHLATQPATQLQSGAYYKSQKVKANAAAGNDPALINGLWTASEALVAPWLKA